MGMCGINTLRACIASRLVRKIAKPVPDVIGHLFSFIIFVDSGPLFLHAITLKAYAKSHILSVEILGEYGDTSCHVILLSRAGVDVSVI